MPPIVSTDLLFDDMEIEALESDLESGQIYQPQSLVENSKSIEELEEPINLTKLKSRER